jgi:N6-adenosine-specific RNA methylase IME4
MTIEEMKKLKVSEIAADDSLLLMWTTGPHLLNAEKLMKAWGFTYKTMFHVWVKTNGGEIKGPKLGFYTRQFAEFLILGTRGNILKYKNDKCPYVPNVFLEDSREHSRKPYLPIDTINRIFKNIPKLEMFARSSVDIKWDVWGNETSKFESNQFEASDILEERFNQIQIMEECSKIKFKGTKKIMTDISNEGEGENEEDQQFQNVIESIFTEEGDEE